MKWMYRPCHLDWPGFQAMVVGLGGSVIEDHKHTEVGTCEVRRLATADGDPLFNTLFAEQMVFVAALMDAVDAWCAEHPEATRVPRSLGPAPLTIGGCTGTRKLATFTHWMAQRPYDLYHGLDEADRAAADRWLERVGGREAMARTVRHRFVRRDFKMGLAS